MTGFVREQVIAWRFGATAAVDAYVVAMVLPGMFGGLLVGMLAAVFIPAYAAERQQGRGGQLFTSTLWALGFLSLASSAMVLVAAPWGVTLIAAGFPTGQQLVATQLLRVLAVTIPLSTFIQFLLMILNVHQHFTRPALHSIAMNAVVIAGLLVVNSSNIIYLAAFTVLSAVVGIVWLLVLLRRLPLAWVGRPKFGDGAFLRMASLTVPILFSTAFGQIYLLVDRRLAAGLDVGSLASLNFANRLVQLPLGILVTALMAVVYPKLSSLLVEGDKAGFLAVLTASLRAILLLFVPASVGLLVLRYPVVQFVYQRGAFDSAATTMTAAALAWYALGLTGLALVSLLPRAFNAIHDTATPVKISIALVPVSTVAALLLTPLMGHVGLAFTASLSPTIAAAVQLYALRRRFGRGSLAFLEVLPKAAVGSASVAIAAHGVYLTASRLGLPLRLAVAIGSALIMYCGTLYLLGVKEVLDVTHRGQGLFQRRSKVVANRE